jgi:hypothetical protein
MDAQPNQCPVCKNYLNQNCVNTDDHEDIPPQAYTIKLLKIIDKIGGILPIILIVFFATVFLMQDTIVKTRLLKLYINTYLVYFNSFGLVFYGILISIGFKTIELFKHSENLLESRLVKNIVFRFALNLGCMILISIIAMCNIWLFLGKYEPFDVIQHAPNAYTLLVAITGVALSCNLVFVIHGISAVIMILMTYLSNSDSVDSIVD